MELKTFVKNLVEDILTEQQKQLAEQKRQRTEQKKPELEQQKPHNNCECDESVCIGLESCEDIIDVKLCDVKLRNLGRLLNVRLKLEKVCPGRKVAVGVLLFEKKFNDYNLIGFKTCEIESPAGPCNHCKDVDVGELNFVIPEKDICHERKLKLKVIANYSSFHEIKNCHC